MLCHASGSLLGLLSLVFIIKIRSVDSNSSSDVQGSRRIDKRAANESDYHFAHGVKGDSNGGTYFPSIVNASEVRIVVDEPKESNTAAASDATASSYIKDFLGELEDYAEDKEDGGIVKADTEARPAVGIAENNSSASLDNGDAAEDKGFLVGDADAGKSDSSSVENAAHKAGLEADTEGSALASPEAERANSIDRRSRKDLNRNPREYEVSIGARLEIPLSVDRARMRFILVSKANHKDYVITGPVFKPLVSGWRYSNETEPFALVISNVTVQDSGTYFFQIPTDKVNNTFVINVVEQIPTPTPVLAIRATPTLAPTLAVTPTLLPTMSVVDRKTNDSVIAEAELEPQEEAEVEPREPEIFFDHESLHQEDYGLPKKWVVGSLRSFTFRCPDPRPLPIVKPAEYVKLIPVEASIWLYRLEFTEAFKSAFFDMRSTSLWCVAEYKTPENYHRNITVWKVDLDYPPSNPKTEMASKVSDKPHPSCGATRISCSAPANPPVNWTLHRVTLDKVEDVNVNVSEECVVRESIGFGNSSFRVPPKTSFYTRLTGEFACVGKNEYGETLVRFAIPRADYTAVMVVVIIILIIVIAILLQRYFVRIKNARKRQQRGSATEGRYHLEGNLSEKGEAPKLADTDQDIAGTNL